MAMKNIQFVFSSTILMLAFIATASNCSNISSDKSNTLIVNRTTEFSNNIIQIALSQSLYTQNVLLRTKETTKNNFEKIMLDDCSHLLNNTIFRLSLALNDANSTISDKQTWLSMALANVETCSAEFDELGIFDHSILSLAKNLTMSIKNALAVSYDTFKSHNDNNRIPSWASNAYRRLLKGSNNRKYAFVVAQDGSGDATTIEEAIDSARKKKSRTGRYVIYVKAGVYYEYINIEASLKKIVIIGEGIGKTIITGNKHAEGSLSTYNTATFGVDGDGFMARYVTFRNTAGPGNRQAVALRARSDYSTFYRCSFEGYQDTLYAFSGRQFYRECDIYGTIDFIFGDAKAIFQNCNIYARKPTNNIVTVTAQKRSAPSDDTGFIIHNSKITASEDLGSVRTYLGRPWGPYSLTVVMDSFLDGLIQPDGWLSWDAYADVNNIYFAEFNNRGPGSSTTNRVKWKGYHPITNPSEASKFTVENFLSGNSWLPSTHVPFTPGM